jgi:methylated-DNA-[protein]-cysteine S-methyltransferase
MLQIQGEKEVSSVCLVTKNVVAKNEGSSAALTQCAKQLREYFRSERKFFNVTLSPEGTDFQKCVWKALLTIPFGSTLTYGEIARKIGKPGAAQAVGQAVGANPLLILVPCHRVLAANGIGGFSCGQAKKVLLIALESSETHSPDFGLDDRTSRGADPLGIHPGLIARVRS